MAIVGVVAASFALRDEEPNPCNVRLAQAVVDVCKTLWGQGHQVVLVTQWEIDKALSQMSDFKFTEGAGRSLLDYDDGELEAAIGELQAQGISLYGVVGPRTDGKYLDTADVVGGAQRVFSAAGVEYVVAVANPFIHRAYVHGLLGKMYYSLLRPIPKVPWIGFDPESTQWWCRSWWQFTLQAIRLKLGIKHGYNGRQEPQS